MFLDLLTYGFLFVVLVSTTQALRTGLSLATCQSFVTWAAMSSWPSATSATDPFSKCGLGTAPGLSCVTQMLASEFIKGIACSC